MCQELCLEATEGFETEEWHDIFDFGIWDMTLFFSQDCFPMCSARTLLSQPLTTSLEDPEGFQSCSALRMILLWQWTHLPILKSPVESKSKHQSHIQPIAASAPSAQPWSEAQSLQLMSTISLLFLGLQDQIGRKEGLMERGKVSLVGAFSDFCTVYFSNGWYILKITSFDTSTAPAYKKIPPLPLPLVGQDTLKIASVQLDIHFPMKICVSLLGAQVYPLFVFSPIWAVTYIYLENSRECKSSSP